ncbi:hypothetical protein [Citrobacter braakii]|uniref:hypothetical protein n=1 Tax=Citrobacter braakii TaxID=57706 RepID=UPI0037A0E08F
MRVCFALSGHGWFVATIAAGVAAANEMYAIAMVITVAAQIATQALTKTPSLNSYRDTSERKQVLRAAASAKTVVYGRSTSAGTLFFSEEQAGEQDDGEMLHLAIALAGHPLRKYTDEGGRDVRW